MNKSTFYSALLILLLSFSAQTSLFAQFPGQGSGSRGNAQGGGYPGATSGMKIAIGRVYGKVIDSLSKKPVGFASVALYKYSKDTVVAGQLTADNGDFSLDNLEFGAYKLKISFVGYKDLIKKVIVTPNKAEQDIGNIRITSSNNTLNSVTITGERDLVELKPDRKVFNVEKDLSARGGTGVDVMKNIPGVSTDESGNVTLRDATPQIYVDGKPTTLTLEQIPADQIDKVEVITNPSAKFDASTTGGIINVLLKQNHTPGYNGIFSMATGTNSQYNGTALLNVREKKFGFMLNYNVNTSGNYTKGTTNRTTLLDNQPLSYFQQIDSVHSIRTFQTGRIGFDYYINNRNTISITENATFGSFRNYDLSLFNINGPAGDTVAGANYNGNRQSNYFFKFQNYTTDISFRHTYPKADKEWTLDFNFNHNEGTNGYTYITNDYFPNGDLQPYNPQLEDDDGGQHSNQFIEQWDFSDPLSKTTKLDFGLRSSYQRQYSFLNVIDYNDSTHQWISNGDLSNNYRIDNLVDAAYVTFSQTIQQFAYQLGIRLEQSYYKGTLLNREDSSFSYQYPTVTTHPTTSIKNLEDCLFPSINLSHKFGDKHEIQLNATRKIQRPNFFQLSPFIFSSDKFDYQIGNPALSPEFDNKVEANYDLILNGFNWLSSVYGTYKQMPITPYSYTEENNSEVLINTFENGSDSWNYGWENTIKVTPVKGLDLTVDQNTYYTSINSDVEGLTLSNSGYTWSVKGVVAYKFPFGLSVQANGTYQSPRVVPQGTTQPMKFADFSASKDFGMMTLNFTVSDIFNSRQFGYDYVTPTYIQDLVKRRDERFARLGMSFRFGKMDASIFKKKKAQQVAPEMNEGDF